jgi:hypothetical protein
METDGPPVVNFAAFLEGHPPGSRAIVEDALSIFNKYAPPELQLHCESERCGGLRIFSCNDGEDEVVAKVDARFLWYQCRNCGGSPKLFSLFLIRQDDGKPPVVVKIGELPNYGPPVPSRVISMVGPDRELFLKGRRAENQNLGIAAFAYYRRVVESQWQRLVDEIIRVAEQSQSESGLVELLRKARTETQFRKAVDMIKESVPESLKIDGHNPLTLLFGALSDGVHDRSDEHCLQLAVDVRAVLTELAERVASSLKDKRELSDSVRRLADRRPRGSSDPAA